MAPFLDVEASYQTMRLLEQHPHLCNLLFELRNNGADWVTTLERLQQALAETAILPPPGISKAGERWSDSRVGDDNLHVIPDKCGFG